jgi:DNA modification methylase
MLTFETWDIEKLIPYDRNPRVNNHAVDKIASAIKEYGFRVPIVAKSDGLIVDGHLRFKAARKLGLTEIPVILADDLTDAQIKAFRISVNKMAELADWDEEMLAIEMQELHDIGYDLDLIGFTPEELEEMDINLEGELEAIIDESKADDVPEVVENPAIKLGDLIELGNHRLLCGDSTKEEDVKRLMDGKKADMVFTDPPYLMDFTGGIHADGSKSFNSKHGGIKNDKMSKEDGNKFLDDVNSMIKKFNNGAFYITFYRLGIGQYFSSMDRVGLQSRALIIWNKGNHTLSNSDYMSKYEPIFYGWVKDHNFYGGKNGMDIWDIKRTAKNDLHPTMKPVELVEKAVFEGSKTKDSVLDLFGGSGTTMIACENLNRRCYGLELDKKYAQVIIQRWCDYTQIDTIKINGETVSWSEYRDAK